MSINKTTTDIDIFKINYLTQEMYDAALMNNQINENELYMVPTEPEFIVKDNSETIAPITTVTVLDQDDQLAYTDFSIRFNGPNYYSTLSITFDNITYICDLIIFGNQNNEYAYGSLDFSDYPFVLYGTPNAFEDSISMQLLLPSNSTQTHTITIKTPVPLSITTSSDFNTAVSYVIDSMKVEGGSY